MRASARDLLIAPPAIQHPMRGCVSSRAFHKRVHPQCAAITGKTEHSYLVHGMVCETYQSPPPPPRHPRRRSCTKPPCKSRLTVSVASISCAVYSTYHHRLPHKPPSSPPLSRTISTWASKFEPAPDACTQACTERASSAKDSKWRPKLSVQVPDRAESLRYQVSSGWGLNRLLVGLHCITSPPRATPQLVHTVTTPCGCTSSRRADDPGP